MRGNTRCCSSPSTPTIKKNEGPFTNDVSSERGWGWVCEKLTITWGGGGGGAYKVDINHDDLKGWGKEEPNEEKLLFDIWTNFPSIEILTS